MLRDKCPHRASPLPAALRFDGADAATTQAPNTPSPPRSWLSSKTQNSPAILLHPWIYSHVSSLKTGATFTYPQDTLSMRGTQQMLKA